MKTTLPERSLVIKDKIDKIVKEILDVAKSKIAMIILFGSYAKGTWVKDKYVEDHTTYIYESDLDILLVTKSSEDIGYKQIALKDKIDKRLENKGLDYNPWITLIFEPIQRVNNELGKKQYFFSDIKKEGIMLFDSGEFELAEPKNLSWEERREIAKEDFEQWFPRGMGFLRNAKYAFTDEDLPLAAFLLHQATESFYNAIWLVFTGYKPKIHDIAILGRVACNFSDELLKIFPRDTSERIQAFILLQKAYIDARYNKNYNITQEQLTYLIKRVEKLKIVTEEICQARINNNH